MKNRSGLRARTLLVAAIFTAFSAGCGSGDDGKIFGEPGGSGTGNPGPAGAGPNLGAAASYGIASTAGVTNTGATTVNGDVILAAPTPTCNAVAVPGGAGTAGLGFCAGPPPPQNGGRVSPPFSRDANAPPSIVRAAMKAGFLGIPPPPGPPAAGSRGGATNLPAG